MKYFIKSSELGFQEATRFIQQTYKKRHINFHDKPSVRIMGTYCVGKSYFCQKLSNIYDVSYPLATGYLELFNVYYIDSNNNEYSFNIINFPPKISELYKLPLYMYQSYALCLFMFSLDDKQSFDMIDEYIYYCTKDIPNKEIMIIGNKNDLKPKVSAEEINAKVTAYNAQYIEISCFKDTDIIESLKKISKISNYLYNLEKSTSNENKNIKIETNDHKCLIF